MAFSFSSNLLTILLASALMITSATKPEPKWSLVARLKLDQHGPSSCYDALFELQSCSGEIVLFFLNGETQLGTNCCKAITTIEHQCWPSMLGSLGITAEECSVLRGYCDKTTADGVSAAAPPPAPAVQKCYSFPRLLP